MPGHTAPPGNVSSSVDLLSKCAVVTQYYLKVSSPLQWLCALNSVALIQHIVIWFSCWSTLVLFCYSWIREVLFSPNVSCGFACSAAEYGDKSRMCCLLCHSVECLGLFFEHNGRNHWSIHFSLSVRNHVQHSHCFSLIVENKPAFLV